MKRILNSIGLLVVCGAACALVLGCNKSQTPASAAAASSSGSDSDYSQTPAVEPAGDGVIRGKVFFDSSQPPPVMRPIDTKNLPACGYNHSSLLEEYAVVNPNKTLKNVLVYLKGAPDVGGAGLAPVIFDQKDCQYVPHVVALRVGQRLMIHNSDDTIHNINAQAHVNPAFNFPQIQAGDQTTKAFKAPEIFSVGCDVHPWMKAYIGVFSNGYFALTGDDGTFEIKNVPPGQYTLVAWHEHYGTLNQGISAEDGKTTQVDLTYKD